MRQPLPPIWSWFGFIALILLKVANHASWVELAVLCAFFVALVVYEFVFCNNLVHKNQEPKMFSPAYFFAPALYYFLFLNSGYFSWGDASQLVISLFMGCAILGGIQEYLQLTDESWE
jgi:hypothetical protein